VLNNRCLFPVLIAVAFAAAVPSASEVDLDPHSPRIRFTDTVIGAALARGLAGSLTFRRMVDRLVASDLIIYVERHGRTNGGRDHGFTQFMSRTPRVRYVRIVIEGEQASDGMVGLLGHELRHAVELAEAPQVIDQESYAALYRAIGRASCAPPRWCFDTRAAVGAGIRVVKELRGRPSPFRR
jgi:hypothetical protein